MSQITDARWAFGSALHVEDPTVGKFFCKGLYTGMELSETQSNWLVGSVPAPNTHEGWRINSVMILFNIRGPYGNIDKIGIRSGHLDVQGFEGLNIGPNTTWELRKLDLPSAASFAYGLGVTIHVQYPEIIGSPGQPPTQFLFTSIGLEFIRSA